MQDHLRRAQYQIHVWRSSSRNTVDHKDPKEYGWSWNEEEEIMTPVWFIGLQIPPTLKKTTKRKQSLSDGANVCYDGDHSDSSGKKVSKKVTNKKKQFKQKSVLTERN